jgi:hypothetical protein
MIRPFLDASREHMSAETWAWLDAQLSDDLLRDPAAKQAARTASGRTSSGWDVYAPGDMPEGFPPDLTVVLSRARARVRRSANRGPAGPACQSREMGRRTSPTLCPCPGLRQPCGPTLPFRLS